MVHSSPSSGIFFQGDGQSQALGNSYMGSYGSSPNLITVNMCSNVVPVSADVSNNVIDSVASSGPSLGASSLVTDANSGLSGGGPRLQRSASINTESYMRLPASPLSFSSNNISISGSSIVDGVQQNSNQDPYSHQVQQQDPCQGASSATSLPPPRLGQVSLSNGARVHGPFITDQDSVSPLQKKPRLDIKSEDIMQQQVLQQILQRQDSMQLHSPDPQLQAMLQEQRLRQQRQQQQQLLQSLPPVQRAHFIHQQQQQQLRQQLQQQGLQPASAVKRPYDAGICSRRLMQYLYHQRQRPADNSIAYWRKFVAEYFSPRAKKRWCLSLYENVGHHSLGVFPQAAMDAWQCDICGSKSGRGFEATFEVLPRLNEIKFGSGVIDELLFFGLPRECRFPSGIMMLEYEKAVQESVYEQLRVVREGRLKVIFTPDLKILTWEFCARRHEELLPRRLVAPQVNQLLQVAQKCQSTIAEKGSDGLSQQDLQTSSNTVVTAGRQLAKSLELQSINDLGFSKRYVRCLQISEVVNSMKDLIDFCQETKAGPLESLKSFPRQSSTAKLQMQKMQERASSIQAISTDRNAPRSPILLHPGLNNSPMNNNGHYIASRGGAPPLGSAQAALAISNYQNSLMRPNSANLNSQHEASSNVSPFQGLALQNGGFSNSHLLQQRPLSGMFQVQQNHHQLPPSQGGSPAAQHHIIQQLLQGMHSNNGGGGGGGGGPKPTLSGQRYASAPPPGTSPRPHVGSATPTRSNSFKGESSAGGGNNGGASRQKTPDLPYLSENVQDIGSEFTYNAFFNNEELEDGMGYGWNA